MNNPEQVNLITDVSDHFSQFCILKSTREKVKWKQIKKRDLSHFNPDRVNSDLATIDWSCIIKTHANRTSYFKINLCNFSSIAKKHSSLKTHIHSAANKISKTNWANCEIKTYCSHCTLLNIYQSLSTPYLTYP